MKSNTQHYSFLGGEVSSGLWYRNDMEKFGRWFANAENIRFSNLGAFENRCGFSRIGPTLGSDEKKLIKLIPFIFNNEEVFEIEFVTGKFRVRKDGEVIVREDGSEVVYESPIKIESLQQLKYAQSGDTVFIASKNTPLMELRRLKKDGTKWELVEFSGELPPLGEYNNEKTEKIELKALTSVTTPEKEPFDLGYAENDTYKEFVLSIEKKDGTSFEITVPEGSLLDKCEFLNNNSLFLDNGLKAILVTKQSFRIQGNGEKKVSKISFTYETKQDSSTKINTTSSTPIANGIQQKYNFPIQGNGGYASFLTLYDKNNTACIAFGDYNQFYKSPSKIGEVLRIKNENKVTDLYATYGMSHNWSLQILGLDPEEGIEPTISFEFVVTTNQAGTSGGTSTTPDLSSFFPTSAEIVYSNYAETVFSANENELYGYPHYSVKAPASFPKLEYGEIFSVENRVDETTIRFETSYARTFISNPIISLGKWRFLTNGNWQGVLSLEYSKDFGATWIAYRTINSISVTNPTNDNAAGSIDTNEIILLRLNARVTGLHWDDTEWNRLTAQLTSESFVVNSYYKILDKTDDRNFKVTCIKNNVGKGILTKDWRVSAFTKDSGYPESVGFYQNRLLLGKEFYLHLSKINDFWDFYEPVDLQKDDPINMSILSYKVNTIKNILSTKSLFIFTTGGEYGITSQGALTQDDKFLKQFSSHGSNDCQPILVGNIIVFVDSTGNTVRAFQYSFEADTYEATEMSYFIEEKLRNKNIITTEYLRNTKECLFLDDKGIIWVFKYIQEQNVAAWSHWKHGKYKITNLCVAPNGPKDDLYVVVEAPDGKFIEKLDDSVFSDSVEEYVFEEEQEEIQTNFQEGLIVNIDDGINNKYKAKVLSDGKIKLRSPSMRLKIGLSYTSTGTLLTPILQTQDGASTSYNRQKISKAYFMYQDSFGFKVGVEEDEKFDVDWQNPAENIEGQTMLTSGKKSVLIANKYDGSSRISFVQEEPYPMKVINVLLESDYGGR